jgi:hypothetical protein
MFRKQKQDNEITPAIQNLPYVMRLKNSINFLCPEYDEHELLMRVLYTLTLVADTDKLKEITSRYHEEATNKEKELENLFACYETPFPTNQSDN